MLRSSKLLLSRWKPLAISSRNRTYPKFFTKMLGMKEQATVSELSNGLKIVVQDRSSYETGCHVCVAFVFDTGSRYEDANDNGYSHFFEHIAFRGNRSSNAAMIRQKMVSSGVRFKCFTQREVVAFYAQCMVNDVDWVVPLLAECVFCNSFDPAQIEQQKDVILAEMNEEDVNSQVLLYDYLHKAAYSGTSLANSVMGPSANIECADPCSLKAFVDKEFDPSRTVVAAAGNIKHDYFHCLASKVLSCVCTSERTRVQNHRFSAGDVRFRDDAMPYAHTAIAFEGPGFLNLDWYTMDVAKHVIGGWDTKQPGGILSSLPIGQAVSSKEPAPGFRSFHIKYSDTGLWGVEFLVESLEIEDVLYNIQQELMHLCATISENELDRGRNQAKTDLMTKQANRTWACLDLAKWVLHKGCYPTLVDRLHYYDAVSAQDIHTACDKYFYNRLPAITCIGPVEGLPANVRVVAGQYFLRF